MIKHFKYRVRLAHVNPYLLMGLGKRKALIRATFATYSHKEQALFEAKFLRFFNSWNLLDKKYSYISCEKY